MPSSKPAPTFREAWPGMLIIVVLAVALVGGCMWIFGGSSLPEKCPDVEGGFELGNLKYGVQNKVKALLHNPDSYTDEVMFTRPVHAKERTDGTEYIGRVEITFTAEGTTGFRQSGRATVDLRKTANGCRVGDARLYE